ncbi:hypothetical protein H4Q26_015443 [Puccinia striiformis f. sp. tritici PST-130]|nr:hypothetical protein H4Q26_015443 [Puccinia striiformis f. sp. tritici PST-130]
MAELTVPTPGAELLHRKRDLIGKAFDDLGTNNLENIDLSITIKPSTFTEEPDHSSFKHNGAIRITEGQRDKLNSISQIQSELDQTLYQIVSLVAVVRRRTLFSPADTDDRHLKELKGFRAQGLQTIVEDLISNMCIVFSTCFEFMGCLKLPSQTLNRYGRIFRHKDMLTLETTRAAHAIDGAIKQLKGHEFYYIREDWEDNVFQIHRLLRLVTDVISSANDSDDDDGDDNDSEIVHPSGPAIRVLQS